MFIEVTTAVDTRSGHVFDYLAAFLACHTRPQLLFSSPWAFYTPGARHDQRDPGEDIELYAAHLTTVHNLTSTEEKAMAET